MLLTGYRKQMTRPECNHQFQSLHCKAQLNEDVGCVLPYLNSVLGGSQYLDDPPELMFHHHGRIIKVGAREIAINALKDETEADHLLAWLIGEINQAWENRNKITPSRQTRKPPVLLEILKLLPRTNCRKCGLATCMVFASLVVAGGRSAGQCPELDAGQRAALDAYLQNFDFES